MPDVIEVQRRQQLMLSYNVRDAEPIPTWSDAGRVSKIIIVPTQLHIDLVNGVVSRVTLSGPRLLKSGRPSTSASYSANLWAYQRHLWPEWVNNVIRTEEEKWHAKQ